MDGNRSLFCLSFVKLYACNPFFLLISSIVATSVKTQQIGHVGREIIEKKLILKIFLKQNIKLVLYLTYFYSLSDKARYWIENRLNLLPIAYF